MMTEMDHITRQEVWDRVRFDPNGCDESLPVIYHWEFREPGGECHGYVGQAKYGSQRPKEAYAYNVSRLLNGEPYRPNKPDDWHRVYRTMAQAVRKGWMITLSLIENCDEMDLSRRERYWIAEKGCTLNG
jgi:hypothetical protein